MLSIEVLAYGEALGLVAVTLLTPANGAMPVAAVAAVAALQPPALLD